MDTKLLARIGAVIFVAIAITMTAIEMSQAPEPARDEPAAVADNTATADPLLIELRRCQSLAFMMDVENSNEAALLGSNGKRGGILADEMGYVAAVSMRDRSHEA